MGQADTSSSLRDSGACRTFLRQIGQRGSGIAHGLFHIKSGAALHSQHGRKSGTHRRFLSHAYLGFPTNIRDEYGADGCVCSVVWPLSVLFEEGLSGRIPRHGLSSFGEG
jgi:hypothetical protein